MPLQFPPAAAGGRGKTFVRKLSRHGDPGGQPLEGIHHGPGRRHLCACSGFARRGSAAGVPFALVGGQAVALWVASREPAAVRTTKDVDILLRREDLPKARAAALAAGMDYFEVMGVGMFLDRQDPEPATRRASCLGWASASGRNTNCPRRRSRSARELSAGLPVVSLAGLVRMKLLRIPRPGPRAFPRPDRRGAHRPRVARRPAAGAGPRLESLLADAGR